MQGKQKIIDDILSSAKRSAAAMIEEASAEQDEQVQRLREELNAAFEQNAESAERAAAAAYDGQVKLGDLEAGKELLRARQACVCAVYDGVKQKLLSAPDGEYLDILKRLIVEACEDGDEVIPARADEKRITAAWVKKVSEAAKKKLTLSTERGDFSGGVVLRNKKYDRALTVDEIVADLKERTVADTVKNLGI